MSDEQRRRNEPGDTIREGVRAITGILGALKDAVEETFDDLRERGDLSPERARDAAESTMRRAQSTVAEMRERFEFVSRREFEALRAEVAELRRALEDERAQGSPADTGAPRSAASTGGDTATEPGPSTAPPESAGPRFTIEGE